MKKLKQWWLKVFDIPTCKKCGSTKLDKGYWSRGWDNYFGGCIGDVGIRCFDCGNTEFETTLEDYKSKHDLKRFKIYE